MVGLYFIYFLYYIDNFKKNRFNVFTIEGIINISKNKLLKKIVLIFPMLAIEDSYLTS